MDQEENKYVQRLKERFLECPVCYEEFTENTRLPRVLPCLHTHCESCLKKLLNETNVKCTLCMKNYSVPDGNLRIFPTDYTRKDLRDFVLASLRQPDLVCEGCDSKDAAKYRCKTCAHFLCEACSAAHGRLLVLKDHEIFSLDDEQCSEENLSKFAHQEICETPGHEREAVHYYCTSLGCEKSICTRCFLLQHKEHDVKDIQEVYSKRKRVLEEEARMLFRRIDECAEIRSKVTSTKEEVESSRSKSIEELNTAFETLENLLKKRKDALMADINTVADRKKEVLQQQENNLEIFSKSIENCCDFLHQSLTYNNQPAFMKIAPIISKRFAYLQTHTLDKEPFETSFILFNGLNTGLVFGTFTQSVGKVESSAFYRPNIIMRTESVFADNTGKVVVELHTYDGDRVKEPLQMEALVLKDGQIHCKPTLSQREDGAYEMVLQMDDSHHLCLKAFDERMTVWEGPVPRPSGNEDTAESRSIPHRPGPPTAPRHRHRQTSGESSTTTDAARTEQMCTSLDKWHVKQNAELESSTVPGRPPLPKRELLQPDACVSGVLSLPITEHALTAAASRQDRTTSRATFHFDEASLHKSRFLSKDRMNLFNRKQTRLPAEGERDERKPHVFNTRTRREQKLQKYQGVKSSKQIILPDAVYFDVDVTYHLDMDLSNDVAIFEIGFAQDSAIDNSDTPGNDKHSCSISAYTNTNDGAIRLCFRHNGKLVYSHTLQASPMGTFYVVTLGINVDTERQAVIVFDRSRVDNPFLCKFTDQDFKAGMWPVFGVFTPQKVDIVLTLKTGSSVVYIPYHV